MNFESSCWSSLALTPTYQIAEVRKVSKLLLFHNTPGGNAQDDPIAIDLLKQDNNCVFWVQISCPNSLIKENLWKFE